MVASDVGCFAYTRCQEGYIVSVQLSQNATSSARDTELDNPTSLGIAMPVCTYNFENPTTSTAGSWVIHGLGDVT